MSKHTPGKWIVKQDTLRKTFDVLETHTGYHNVIAQHHDEKTARLIASAPEMYEALKIMTMLVTLKYGNLDKDVWEKIAEAQALLSRIEGDK